MAWTEDTFSAWWNLGEDAAETRNLKHIGDHDYEPWGGNAFSFWKTRIDNAIIDALSQPDDPPTKATLTIALIAMQDMMRLINMLMYAAHDLREGSGSAPMSKEDVFDLWLDRAAEMIV